MVVVRFTASIMLSAILSGFVAPSSVEVSADPSPAVPDDLAVDRKWSSNADGYIFSVGYFTSEQVASKAWETARLESRQMANFCDSERLAHRDVRWFEPIAPGEPSCGIVVYSFACSPRKPAWGTSMEYERQQALLDEPESPIPVGCGAKSRKALLPPVSQMPRPSGILIAENADCRTMPDAQLGKFQLHAVNYVKARTFVSPSFVRAVSNPYPDAAHHFAHAAAQEQKVHIVTVDRPLADDGKNLFIEQTFAVNQKSMCVTLAAWQGSNMWRKTMRADLSISSTGSNTQNAKPLDQYAIAKALQLDLATHMGIKVAKPLQSSSQQ